VVASMEMKRRPSDSCRTCHGKRVNGARTAQINAIQRDTWRPFGTNLARIRSSARRELRSHLVRWWKVLEPESCRSSGRLRPQWPDEPRKRVAREPCAWNKGRAPVHLFCVPAPIG